MPQSPKVRFARPRATPVTGNRGRLIAAASRATKAGNKKRRISHWFTYWHNSALCSCGWFLLDVDRLRGEEAFLAHKNHAVRREQRRAQASASTKHHLTMRLSRDPGWPNGHPKKRDAACGCGWQIRSAESARTAREAYEKHLGRG